MICVCLMMIDISELCSLNSFIDDNNTIGNKSSFKILMTSLMVNMNLQKQFFVHSSIVGAHIAIMRTKLECCICIQGHLGVAKQHRLVCAAARQPAQNFLYPL